MNSYLVTRWELATEGNLLDLLHRYAEQGHKGIPSEELFRYMQDAAEGIDFLNGEKGIYHRDIKPPNLLLFHGHVKLADLGLAKFAGASTVSHTGSGTLGYLPPEAYGQHRLSKTVDLYSLAATYVKLRTGREPFGDNPTELIQRQLAGGPILDGLQPAEADLVRAALAAKPEDRPKEGSTNWVRSVYKALRGGSRQAGNKQESGVSSSQGMSSSLGPFGGQQRVLPGVDTLATAVAQAADRSVLLLAPGEFHLSEPLVVEKSLAIQAEQRGQAKLISGVGACVVRFVGKQLWLIGVELEFRGAEGDVLVVDHGNVQIEHCRFEGGRVHEDSEVIGAGLRARGNATGSVVECVATGNCLGIALTGNSQLLVRKTICQGNTWHGIYVCQQAQPTLEQNQCLENGDCGIAYFGTSCGTASENVCRANKLHGIGVGEQAQPTLEQNQCVQNGQVGIVYLGRSCGTAVANVCRANEKHGIYVGEEAQPTLQQNECLENADSGIAYFGTSCGTASANLCRANKGNGIYVGEEAQPTLEKNECLENGRGGDCVRWLELRFETGTQVVCAHSALSLPLQSGSGVRG